MISARQSEIKEAMACGVMASQVSDNSLFEAVRSKLIDLGTTTGHPLAAVSVTGIVSAVLRAAAQTLIFQDEVVIALDMGAHGELEPIPTSISQTNVQKWVAAYACCGDRRAAQNYISIQSMRDRARIDAVEADEKRRDFEESGLARAWDNFINTGTIASFPFTAAALFARLDKQSVKSLLSNERLQDAKAEALKDYRHQARTECARGLRPAIHAHVNETDAEIERYPYFEAMWKARIVRAYFEELKARGLDITYKAE